MATDDSARRPLKSRSTGWARALSSALVARKVSPNGVSIFGIFVALDGTDRFMGFGAAYVEREAARGAQGDLAMLSDFLKPMQENCGVVPVRPLARTATDAVTRGRSRSQRSPVRA